MKYTFDKSTYRLAHGKDPKGTAHWAFTVVGAKIPGIAPEAYVDDPPFNVPQTTFWVPGVWTLTDAKKRATAILAANAVPEWAEIEIAP